MIDFFTGWLEGLKIMVAILIGILILYAVVRTCSAAIFRSFYQMKDKYNKRRNDGTRS